MNTVMLLILEKKFKIKSNVNVFYNELINVWCMILMNLNIINDYCSSFNKQCTLSYIQVQDQFCSVRSYIRTMCSSQFKLSIESFYVGQSKKDSFTVYICDHVLYKM